MKTKLTSGAVRNGIGNPKRKVSEGAKLRLVNKGTHHRKKASAWFQMPGADLSADKGIPRRDSSGCAGKRGSCTRAEALSTWSEWSAIAVSGYAGLWLERNGNSLAKTLSAPLIATLLGLLATNVGLIPSSSEVYGFVGNYLLALAVPMLLFGANMTRVFKETKQLLGAFVIGSVATLVATTICYRFIPLTSLGQDSWKIASALSARHIGKQCESLARVAVYLNSFYSALT